MSGAARPLQPATAFSPAVAAGDAPRANGSISPPDSTRPPGGRRQKRTLIESACSACRKRKSRCDGVRPSCSRCMNLRTDCQYEAEEGESRWSALRRRNEIFKGERDQLRELLDLLQGRPEYEALDIFHRIRSGTYGDVSHLLQQARDGALTSPHQLSNPHLSITVAADQQRLPPLKALFDNVSSRPPPPTSSSDFPASLLHTQSTSSEDSRSSSISLQNGRSVPDMLEPAFHHLPPTRPPIPKVSSEESSTSVGSSTVDLRPYRIPP